MIGPVHVHQSTLIRVYPVLASAARSNSIKKYSRQCLYYLNLEVKTKLRWAGRSDLEIRIMIVITTHLCTEKGPSVSFRDNGPEIRS